MSISQNETAKKIARKILEEYGIKTADDFYNQDEEDIDIVYENLKAGVMEEYNLNDDDMNEILEEIL